MPSTSASTYLEDESGRGWPYIPNLARLDRVGGGIVSIISDIHMPFRRLEESMAEFCLIAILSALLFWCLCMDLFALTDGLLGWCFVLYRVKFGCDG